MKIIKCRSKSDWCFYECDNRIIPRMAVQWHLLHALRHGKKARGEGGGKEWNKNLKRWTERKDRKWKQKNVQTCLCLSHCTEACLWEVDGHVPCCPCAVQSLALQWGTTDEVGRRTGEAEMLAVTKNAINYRVTIIASVVESAPLNGRESLLLTTTPPDLLSHSGRFILLLALNARRGGGGEQRGKKQLWESCSQIQFRLFWNELTVNLLNSCIFFVLICSLPVIPFKNSLVNKICKCCHTKHAMFLSSNIWGTKLNEKTRS